MRREAQTALAQLSEDALQHMILELGRYALSVSRRLHWRTGDAVELPRGETVDSIVSLAFTKVLTGERRWEPHKDPDLKRYLMDVIDSLLNHLAEHKDNTVLTERSDEGRGGATSPRDPETELLRQEKVRREAHVLQLLLDEAHDDPLVMHIIRTMQDGYGKAGEIATVLGIAVTDVYNAMKRLERKIVRVRQRIQEPQGAELQGGK